jgi:CheY-like chemotaxis protein
VKPVRAGELLDRLAFALADRAGGAQEPQAADIDLAPRFDARVLLAEDNRVNQKVALRMLERLGCQITTADNGREAVEMFDPSRYDLILMDCQMPEMDGYAATAAIRERPDGKEIPIIALTAHAMQGAREKCLASGMNDYLAKPIRPGSMQEALSRWLKPSSVAAS